MKSRRKKIYQSREVDVLEAKYAVQRLKPLLYLGGASKCSSAAVEILGMIGGVEAETALRTFIHKQTGVKDAQSLASKARAALGTLNATKQAPSRR